jgi:hypothetical protein
VKIEYAIYINLRHWHEILMSPWLAARPRPVNSERNLIHPGSYSHAFSLD